MALVPKTYRLTSGVWLPVEYSTGTPVEPPPPPPPTTTGMMVGVDVSLNGAQSASTLKAEIPRVCNTLGIDPTSKLPLGNHLKVFQASSVVSAGQKYEETGYKGRGVLAHKSTSLSDWNARMDVITKPEVWIYWQERGYKKGPSPSAYSKTYAQMDAARKNHPNGRLVLLCMDGARSQEEQQRQWDQLTPADGNVDYIGMDCYRAGGLPNKAPQVEFRELLAMWNYFKGTYSALKGFCIPEFGLGRTNSDGSLMDPDARAAELQADFDWLDEQGCVWTCYWEEDNSLNEDPTHDYRTAPDKVVRDVLLGAITREVLP